jgi:hypothetical protein
MDIIKNAGSDFDSMISLAKNNLPEASDCEFGICAIVKTVKKNLLIHKIAVNSVEELINEERRIVSELEVSSDTEAEKIVCMWNNGTVDVPSYSFMQDLCKLDAKNRDARIILNSGEGFRAVRIADIIWNR